jgi:hypothetical protein
MVRANGAPGPLAPSHPKNHKNPPENSATLSLTRMVAVSWALQKSTLTPDGQL